jgi:hypothetical protein
MNRAAIALHSHSGYVGWLVGVAVEWLVMERGIIGPLWSASTMMNKIIYIPHQPTNQQTNQP